MRVGCCRADPASSLGTFALALGDLAGWVSWPGLIARAAESSVLDSKVFLSRGKTSGACGSDSSIYRRVHLR